MNLFLFTIDNRQSSSLVFKAFKIQDILIYPDGIYKASVASLCYNSLTLVLSMNDHHEKNN